MSVLLAPLNTRVANNTTSSFKRTHCPLKRVHPRSLIAVLANCPPEIMPAARKRENRESHFYNVGEQGRLVKPPFNVTLRNTNWMLGKLAFGLKIRVYAMSLEWNPFQESFRHQRSRRRNAALRRAVLEAQLRRVSPWTSKRVREASTCSQSTTLVL